jgi:hypothetical protein
VTNAFFSTNVADDVAAAERRASMYHGILQLYRTSLLEMKKSDTPEGVPL